MKIALGGDHAGYEYKSQLIDILTKAGHECEDFGTHGLDSVDYPDYVHPLAQSVKAGKQELGILICGSANGVAMTANKHAGIRAAICWEKELAALSRQHNNANIVCIPARFVAFADASEIVSTFLQTPFEGGRHENRVNKINC